MPDFSRGKIYKITGGGLTYYGSTTLKYLSQRLSGHKQDKQRAKMNGSCFQILDYPDCQITLVESYSCNNVNELRARERFFIEHNDCVNKNIPGRTKQEWLEQNKDYQQNYREQNKEKYLTYQRNYRAKQKNKLPTETTNRPAETLSEPQ
jgi:hypothetical protein